MAVHPQITITIFIHYSCKLWCNLRGKRTETKKKKRTHCIVVISTRPTCKKKDEFLRWFMTSDWVFCGPHYFEIAAKKRPTNCQIKQQWTNRTYLLKDNTNLMYFVYSLCNSPYINASTGAHNFTLSLLRNTLMDQRTTWLLAILFSRRSTVKCVIFARFIEKKYPRAWTIFKHMY